MSTASGYPKTEPEVELFRPLNVTEIWPGEGEEGKRITIEATAAELADLAERFAILAVKDLAADLVLTVSEGGREVAATGRLSARVVQACVVTLAPVGMEIDAAFNRVFAEGARGRQGGLDGWEGRPEAVEIHLESGRKEPPDSMTGGWFDLGEALTEQLALELDPFPRAEGAVFDQIPALEGPAAGEQEEKTGKDNPFAVLEKLKKDRA